jgi:hypothetical protein
MGLNLSTEKALPNMAYNYPQQLLDSSSVYPEAESIVCLG